MEDKNWEGKARNIIREEIGNPLRKIEKAINKSKKTDYFIIIA